MKAPEESGVSIESPDIVPPWLSENDVSSKSTMTETTLPSTYKEKHITHSSHYGHPTTPKTKRNLKQETIDSIIHPFNKFKKMITPHKVSHHHKQDPKKRRTIAWNVMKMKEIVIDVFVQ